MLASTTILGKRKRTVNGNAGLVLRLTSESDPDDESHVGLSDNDPDFSESVTGPSSSKVLASHSPLYGLTERDDGRLKCQYDGCEKAYRKPSRLEEHIRSHTGERPFVCSFCKKSYFRENHLQAHTRTHLPASDKPFACSEDSCERRFWTTQHLRSHEQSVHRGKKTFKCTEAGCDQAFLKHHQLRAHICEIHAPPGTKPYRCEHEGCTQSFETNQKLNIHLKVHDTKRYTCTHIDCLLNPLETIAYFSTWTSLQQHMRTVHPAKCSYPECNSRTFASQKGLRGHLRLHEMREIEANLVLDSDAEAGEGEERSKRKKRRGGELGRDWCCEVEGCGKDFKSKKALKTHHHVSHLNRRDFVCPHAPCGRAFGYKHLLQRHLAKLHAPPQTSSSSSSDEEAEPPHTKEPSSIIDSITGAAYVHAAQARLDNARALRCPYPHTPFPLLSTPPSGTSSLDAGLRCEYVFSRAYDLRRHLRAEHGLDASKTSVDTWVANARKVSQGDGLR